MEAELQTGWQQQKVGLKHQVHHLQEQLADCRAEMEELESRARALNDRLWQSVSPSLALSLQLEGEQRLWRRRVREGREREARQALIIHRLQNKVLEYSDRCQRLECELQDEVKQLLNTERRIRDEHSDSLESALIRLEEEQQRSVGLAETNTLLRDQLSQSEQANQALREDLQKLTADWTRAMEETESTWLKEKESQLGREGQHQTQLLSVWRSVVALRQHFHSVKTATDRDLWQLKAEFSRLSSSLRSSCESVSSSLRLNTRHLRPLSLSVLPPHLPSDLPVSSLSPPLTSTLALPRPISPLSEVPPVSTSTLGTFILGELEHKEEEEEEKMREVLDLKLVHDAEVSQLKERIAELSRMLEAELSQREEREQETERQRETERSLQSVSQAVVRLSRVLSSSSSRPLCISSERVLSLDLSSLLSVLSQTESTLQWNHEELQGKIISAAAGDEKSTLEFRAKQLEDDNQQLQMHTQLKLTHTQDLLNSVFLQTERDSRTQVQSLTSEVSSLQREVKPLNADYAELRAQKEAEAEAARQLIERNGETQRIIEEKETALMSMMEEREKDKSYQQEMSSQLASVCGKLKEVQEQLQQAGEEMMRRDRQQEEQQREGRRLQEENVTLQRHEDRLNDELQQLRSLSVSLHQQLSQQQKQLSESEVDRCLLQTHVHALQQAKETLHGEIDCLRGELERAITRTEDEKDMKERVKEGRETLQEKMEGLTEEAEELKRRRKQVEEQRREEREAWQREREALSEELGNRDGEVEALRRRIEGLREETEKSTREVANLNQEREAVRTANEEMKRLESKVKEMQEEKEEELKRVREEKRQLEDKLTEKEKKIYVQMEMLRSKEELQRKAEDELRKAKLEEGRLVDAERDQHLLVVERGRSIVQELEEEKEGLLVELRRKEKEMTALREEVERERNRAQEELRRREEEASILREAVQKNQREKEMVQEELEKMKEEVTTLRDEVQKEWREREDVQEELRRSQEELRRKEVEVTAVREEVQKIQRQNKDSQGEITTLKGELREQLRRSEEAQEELRRTKKELAAITLELQTEQIQKLARAEKEVTPFKEVDLERKEESETLQEKIKGLTEEVEELKRDRKKVTKQRREEREAWQREREALSEELGNRDGEVEALRRRIEGLTEERQREVETLRKEVTEKEAQVSDMVDRLQCVERERQRLEEDIKRTEVNLREEKVTQEEIRRDESMQRDREIEALCDRTERLERKEESRNKEEMKKEADCLREEAEEEVARWKAKVNDLEVEMNKLKTEISQLEEEKTRSETLQYKEEKRWNEEVERLRGEAQRAGEELEKLRSRVEEVESERDQEKSKNEKLQDEKEEAVRGLMGRLTAQEGEIEELRVSLSVAKEMCEEMKEEVAQREGCLERQMSAAKELEAEEAELQKRLRLVEQREEEGVKELQEAIVKLMQKEAREEALETLLRETRLLLEERRGGRRKRWQDLLPRQRAAGGSCRERESKEEIQREGGGLLVALQYRVAELELEQERLTKRNSLIKNQKEKLKKDRNNLRDTLRQVEEERLKLKLQLTDSSRCQVRNECQCENVLSSLAFCGQESAGTTEEEQLRSRVQELEDQVMQLCLSLAVERQQREEFIQQSSRNSQELLSVRRDLIDSLAAVTRHPIPSVLESETQRLDRSLREEELRMSLRHS
ncbi:hypothetical protein Q5P01_014215 [Channa striata]|uniref:Rootletin-like coiled-coil domain-containing protein n=1 Tax=Channa striata TaxID=64152 RepID=A0AA88MNV1_CHASR|nr:hypothetical protein Q5P01_014215 [Channa striata]